jgi:hypothetical protein
VVETAIMDDQKPNFPSFKTEYDRLCEDLGGPADLGRSGFENHLRRACGACPLRLILPVLIEFKPDGVDFARRHWPWAALALELFVRDQKERTKHADEPNPKDVEALLLEIAQSARALNAGLNRLQDLSYRVKEPTAPYRRGHLGWLDTFISQGVVGNPSNDVTENPGVLALLQDARSDFAKRLATIEATAIRASERVDRSLLDRERGQRIPGLSDFVFRCGEIWKNLTGRIPSAHKVSRLEGPEDPDFVVFVGNLAEVGQTPVPTRRQVENSLRS